VLLAACAAFVAAVTLGLPGSGCLNPRPEEVPGADANLFEPAMVERETCEDNPLLAGCDLPDEDINGAPVEAPAPNPTDLDGPEPESPPPGDAPEAGASAGGAGGGDAGSDVQDAGAP
jgi:hypothetical protein